MKKEIINVCKKLHSKNFVAFTDGNVSVRISESKILCTPTSIPKEKLATKDLVVIDLSGKIISGTRKPSNEIKMHLEIYRQRKDVNAVVHAHPIYATAFASSKIALDQPILPEVILNLGKVPVCPYATPSTTEVVKSIKPYITKTNAILLQNHGAVTYGKTLEEAYYLMEKLEHTAQIYCVLMNLGGARKLNKTQLAKLYEVNEKVYKISQIHKISFNQDTKK